MARLSDHFLSHFFYGLRADYLERIKGEKKPLSEVFLGLTRNNPVVVTVKKIAPLAIKAPANMARTNMVQASRLALSTPTFSIRCAISGGGKASIRICSLIPFFLLCVLHCEIPTARRHTKTRI